MFRIPKHTYRTAQSVNKTLGLRPPKKFYGWLGTGLLSTDGREIIEGDIVFFEGDADRYTIKFENGCFCLDTIDYPLFNYKDGELTIVGHVTDDYYEGAKS